MIGRLLAFLALLSLFAFPAYAADRKPLVIGATGQQQQIQAGDQLLLQPATTANSSIVLPHGTAATSPTNGAMWTTITGLYVRINGVTVGPLGAGCTTFTCLSDTPGNYTSAGLKVVRVNTGATALEYVTPGAFFLGSSATDLASGTLAYARLPSQSASTLLGRDSAGAGVPEVVTLGSGLSMSAGAVLSATGTGGTVTTTGSPASGNLTKFSGATSITNGDLSGDCTTSGTLAVTCVGPWSVAKGGTGSTTLGAHCVLLGNGTGALATACPSIAGQQFFDNGPSADPSFATATVSSNPFTFGTTLRTMECGSGVPTTTARKMGSLWCRTDKAEEWLALLPSAAVPTRVQEVAAVSTYAVTLPSTPIQGNFLVGACFEYTGTPAAGTGWTSIASQASGGSQIPGSRLVYHQVITGDTTAQTPCTGSPDKSVTVWEVSGLDPGWTASFQASSFASNSATFGAGYSVTLTATTSSANTLALTAFGEHGASGDRGAPTINAGWTNTVTDHTTGISQLGSSQAYASTSSSVTSTGTIASGASLSGATGALILLQPPPTGVTGWVPFLRRAVTAPSAGQIAVFDTDANLSILTGASVSQDCTATSALVFTCLKTNNVSFGTSATVNTGTSGATIPLLNGNNTFSGTTTLTNTLTTNVTGAAASCLQVNTSGVVSGTGTACGSGSGSVGTTGSPANGNLTQFSGASTITNGDLSGDCTTSGTLAVTCTKNNGGSTTDGWLISEATPSGTGVVTFSSLGSCRSLRVTGMGRTSAAVTSATVQMTFNSDGAGNYRNQRIYGNNATAATSNAGTAFIDIGDLEGTSSSANYPAHFWIDIPDFGGTTFYKTVLGQSNLISGTVGTTTLYVFGGHAGWWANTAAITRIDLTLSSGNWVSGSRVSLYCVN